MSPTPPPRVVGRFLRHTGFHRQLTFTVTAAIVCLALVSSLMNTLAASWRVKSQLVDTGRQVTENFARQSTLALLTHEPDNAAAAVGASLAFPDVLQVEIFDAAGRLLLRSTERNAVDLLPVVVASPAPGATGVAESSSAWVFTAPVLGGTADDSPFEAGARNMQPLGHVRVVLGKASLNRLLISLLAGNLLITFTIAVILLAILGRLTRRMTTPLAELSELMQRAEAGESGMRAQPSGPRDIHDMAQAFNQMMHVLEVRESLLTQSRDEATRAALAKAQFAATVSHEVRTPLNGVLGMLEMLREMRLSRQQQEYVDEAWRSAHMLAGLVDNILDFSKLDAGKLALEDIEFDLRQQVEEVVELLAGSAQDKGVELGYLMTPETPERVRGDPVRLRQVLINLVGNAVKFTEQGEVSVRIDAKSVALDGVVLELAVHDTGIGMDEETIANAFDAFSQADRSTKRKYGGTGLGLAICKQLVEVMGGRIDVISVPGAGSTFRVTVQVRAADDPGPRPQCEALVGRNVLVVDGSETVRRFVATSLEGCGAHCETAIDGDTGMRLMRQAAHAGGCHALVVIGAGVASAQGATFASRIRSDPRFADVRLLALTHRAAGGGGAPMGSDAYVEKPLRLDRLLDAVRRLILGELRRPSRSRSPAHGPSDREMHGAERDVTAPLDRPFCALVAEDNRTNRVVAAGMLRMLGGHCTLVSNGREAVEAVRGGDFDLVLMDCSMPEMDGYEATAQIRQMQESTGHRTPVIAMTANAQRGDGETCLAAGMDDHLPKPITLAILRQKLERWLPGAHGVVATPALEPARTGLSDGPLDRNAFEKLRDVLGTSLHEAVTPFLEDIPAYLTLLAQAVEDDNPIAACAMAHSIKGSSANLGAVTLSQLARQAQDAAEGHRLEEVRPLLPQLRDAFDMVSAVLSTEVQGTEGGHVSTHMREEAALVLVVDDDRSTRSALRHALQRDGFRVEEAVDGTQALALLERLRPEVILMDAMMPVMDGFTACALVKLHPQGATIPVLMITALEDNTSVERAFAAGANDYIPKPIHFAVLSQRVRSIVDANRAARHIHNLAYTDSLTGLPNRAQFLDQLNDRIERASRSGGSVAILFLDLDRFKNVNDTLGHNIGDRLLIAAGNRIRSAVRRADCVARLGGDEFIVALTDVTAADAAVAARNICRTLSDLFRIDGNDLFTAASIGISLFPRDGTDVSTLLKHADVAMYKAKRSNTGVEFFEASMEQSLSAHVRLESELRCAIERNELEVFYQPKALVDGTTIVGMEALVRWRHPTRGLVPPNDFIPLAEETGLILPLGELVLRTACSQVQAWVRQGMKALPVAVNISGRQLQQPDFVHCVERALRDTGLPPHLLELEITESTLMEDAEATLELLHRLRELGVRLSIDDFGTGYSSLVYLKRFPMDALKIDRAFIRDLPGDADDVVIASAIIALAHSLHLDVVAEGVETREQRAFLEQSSCDLIQGYLLSEPLPAKEFEQRFLIQSPSVDIVDGGNLASSSDGRTLPLALAAAPPFTF